MFRKKEGEEMKTMKEIHETYCCESVVSNFDHVIDMESVKHLKENESWSKYPAENFHGSIYFDKELNKFVCFVERYKELVETVIKDTVQEIHDYCCDKWGYE
jgi:hypothetical protein